MTVLLAILAVVFIVALIAAIETAIIFFGWNLGVVALVAACGGHVGHIGFWTAFFVGLALSIARSLLRGNRAAEVSS